MSLDPTLELIENASHLRDTGKHWLPTTNSTITDETMSPDPTLEDRTLSRPRDTC